MRRGLLLSCALAGIVAGGAQAVAARQDAGPSDWRRVATLPDRDRLRRLRDAWVEGVRLAYAKGAGPAIRAEGALLDPDVAQSDPLPPAGAYRCRIFKLGGTPGFAVSPFIDCRVSVTNGGIDFATLGAGQRTAGRMYADTDIRGIFLGVLGLPEEKRIMPYGRDATRDEPGVVRRIGTAQWRISFPYPRFESTLDVIELTPIP